MIDSFVTRFYLSFDSCVVNSKKKGKSKRKSIGWQGVCQIQEIKKMEVALVDTMRDQGKDREMRNAKKREEKKE